ncbi:MAG: hypothetical protein QM589_12415 [Thermomicrobiales bacterium]
MTDRERDDEAPVPLWRMTPDEQIRQQTGPGTEWLPGFVVVDPGPNAWYQDADGVWRQVDDADDYVPLDEVQIDGVYFDALRVACLRCGGPIDLVKPGPFPVDILTGTIEHRRPGDSIMRTIAGDLCSACALDQAVDREGLEQKYAMLERYRRFALVNARLPLDYPATFQVVDMEMPDDPRVKQDGLRGLRVRSLMICLDSCPATVNRALTFTEDDGESFVLVSLVDVFLNPDSEMEVLRVWNIFDGTYDVRVVGAEHAHPDDVDALLKVANRVSRDDEHLGWLRWATGKLGGRTPENASVDEIVAALRSVESDPTRRLNLPEVARELTFDHKTLTRILKDHGYENWTTFRRQHQAR